MGQCGRDREEWGRKWAPPFRLLTLTQRTPSSLGNLLTCSSAASAACCKASRAGGLRLAAAQAASSSGVTRSACERASGREREIGRGGSSQVSDSA